MDMNEFYNFLNESTYINNVNTGQVMVPEMSQAQQSFKPNVKETKNIIGTLGQHPRIDKNGNIIK